MLVGLLDRGGNSEHGVALQSRKSKVEGASHSVLSGSHQFLSIFVTGTVSEAS